MGLITILGEDNFTSQFYVKKGGDSRKSTLIDLSQDKMAISGHIMAKFGKNMGLITILAENNLTSLFQVKEGADCQKLIVIELTQDAQDGMTIFGHHEHPVH